MLSKIGNLLTSRLMLGVAVVVFAWVAWHEHFAKAPVKLKGQVQLNDSTVAAPTNTSLGRHELPALTDAARALNGEVVAGVSFHTRPDSTVRSLKEVTTSRVDSTRKAVLVDTTKMGLVLRIDAEAPPFPSYIKLGYSLIVPAFHPTVGFVRSGDSFAAVVTWGGEQITVDNAFVLSEKKWKVVAGLTVEGDTATIHTLAVVPEGYFGVKRKLGNSYEFLAAGIHGVTGPWKARLGLERVLWSR